MKWSVLEIKKGIIEIWFHQRLWGVESAAWVWLLQHCWHALNDQFNYTCILMVGCYSKQFCGTSSDLGRFGFSNTCLFKELSPNKRKKKIYHDSQIVSTWENVLFLWNMFYISAKFLWNVKHKEIHLDYRSHALFYARVATNKACIPPVHSR